MLTVLCVVLVFFPLAFSGSGVLVLPKCAMLLCLPLVSLQALTSSPALDEYLAQADCLRALFVALNDESKDVRATAVQLVGRLASWNPAYVAPALRRHLLQLLTDMDNSPDSKQRDDSAYLINCLINSAPQLIMPYVSPIQKVRAACTASHCCVGMLQLDAYVGMPGDLQLMPPAMPV
jgi:phosphatidylinositol kinase/protein kinase (PI-3  family)